MSPPTKSACSAPEISTPQAAAWPAVGKKAASASVTIIDRLSSVEAAAAAANQLQRVEDAAIERHQSDQQQIGKGDTGEIDGERETSGIAREFRREDVDDGRREQ